MGFEIKSTKKKIPSTYKSLYIKNDLVRKIEFVAKKYDTSFNNVIISMLESCLDENFDNEVFFEIEENETKEKNK